jgi:choline dehydrogenase-like flavoprotein
MKATETSPSAHVKKSQPEEFDLVILGGGTGSTVAAWTFASEGKRVAVVEYRIPVQVTVGRRNPTRADLSVLRFHNQVPAACEFTQEWPFSEISELPCASPMP